MKKFIIASMVAIAMLVGIQPVFAEQFIVPEVSTSDSQCYVLDLPAGATDEAPEYAAPWQVPQDKEISISRGQQTDWFFGDWLPAKFEDFGSLSRFFVSVEHNQTSNVTMSVYAENSNGDPLPVTPATFNAGPNQVTNKQIDVSGSAVYVEIGGSGTAYGSVMMTW